MGCPGALAVFRVTAAAGNPLLTDGAEASMLMADANTCDQWYRLVGNTTLYHRTADNAALDNWGSGTTLTGVSGEFPEVFKVGSTYYMLVKQSGALYLYSSSDKLAWSVANSGNPVVSHSGTATNWAKTIFNVGAIVVGSTLHLLVEGTADSGTYSTQAWLGYTSVSFSDPTNCTATLASTPHFAGGNAFLMYSSTRTALIAIYSSIEPDYATGHWTMHARLASTGSDLTNPATWVLSTAPFAGLGTDAADPALVFTPGKNRPSLFYWNYGQHDGYQGYGNVADETALYDALPT